MNRKEYKIDKVNSHQYLLVKKYSIMYGHKIKKIKNLFTALDFYASSFLRKIMEPETISCLVDLSFFTLLGSICMVVLRTVVYKSLPRLDADLQSCKSTKHDI